MDPRFRRVGAAIVQLDFPEAQQGPSKGALSIKGTIHGSLPGPRQTVPRGELAGPVSYTHLTLPTILLV
eukprot:2492819-Pyramimonas_sp.AAC.1